MINDQVQVVESNMKGPLGFGLSALLIGRSSTSVQGIFVLPGLIDADYTGPIKIMVKAFFPPIFIAKGTYIAQLIPFRSMVPNPGAIERQEAAFGSTNDPQVYFSIPVSNEKPTRWVTFLNPDGRSFPYAALIDTGADVSIVPRKIWPVSWPLQVLQMSITGIGGSQPTCVSENFITIQDNKDLALTAKIKPYIVDTPILLLGRDCLSQWGLTLITSPF